VFASPLVLDAESMFGRDWRLSLTEGDLDGDSLEGEAVGLNEGEKRGLIGVKSLSLSRMV